MQCDKCERKTNEAKPLLSHFINGKPVFKMYCKECEKEIWQAMKLLFIGDK